MTTQSTKHSTTYYFKLMGKVLEKHEKEIEQKNRQSKK